MSEQNNNPEKEKFNIYDDIVEHNNPMPRWWIWSFVICVIFAIFYYTKYEILKGPTLVQELKEDMKLIESLRIANNSTSIEISDDAILAKANSPEMIQKGEATYTARCAVCHGSNLEGKIGPNLSDATWKNGTGTPKEIFQIIREGVPANGMPPWKDILSEDEVYAVLGFIIAKKQ